MVKPIAIYLPQFHRVKENDDWWGEGFTDWVAVKNAKPLFHEHNQPRIPLGNSYYNLLDYNVMKWQAETAKKYSIAGFCFYHYWFKDGRKILEKPAENLLNWKDIDMPFCFSWANETWARTWSNISNSNAWVDSEYENNILDGNRSESILLEQKYGNESSWKEHFDYLLPFFKDKRYICYEDKPIFLIYKPESIPCLDNMLEYWKKLAYDNGLNGLYIISVRSNNKLWSNVDSWLLQEFDYGDVLPYAYNKNGVRCFDYHYAWKYVLDKAYNTVDNDVFYGGFVDVDDTPRRGNNGTAIINANPKDFEKYFFTLARLANIRKRELIFINAWNEWGEGAYLEPDEKYGYGYLEAIKNVIDNLEFNKESIKIEENDSCYTKIINAKKDKDLRKNKKMMSILHQWLLNKEEGKDVKQYFLENKYNNIAIYGMGILGKHLESELKESSIKIVYALDNKSKVLYDKKLFFEQKEYLLSIDAIIVTPIAEFKQIRELLKTVYDKPIISLEEVIMEL